MISNADAFKPSAHWVEKGRAMTGLQSKQNPSAKDLRAGIYKPRLTLMKRAKPTGLEIILKIELSLPKLLFGNNFDELARKDFTALTQKLAVTLETMGVSTTPEQLAAAEVSVIHYSKNMVLTDGSIPYQYINKIKEANVQLSLDVNRTEYRSGHGIKWHSNSYEVAFYDKIKDLEVAIKSSKRSFEKDSEIQLEIFEKLQKRMRLEFLRMEVRLNRRQKMKSLFKKLGIKSYFTFDSLFRRATAKKVLLHYLDELEARRPSLLDYRAPNDAALLAALVVNNPEMNHKQLLQMYGLKKALEVVDMRELRRMLHRCSDRSWHRLMDEAKKVSLPSERRIFASIKDNLMKFSPLRLKLKV